MFYEEFKKGIIVLGRYYMGPSNWRIAIWKVSVKTHGTYYIGP